MSKWVKVRIKTEPAKMRFVQSRVMGYPEEATQKYFFQAMQSVTASAADIMRNYIEYQAGKTTKTGRKGRVVSGAMRDGVKWTGEKLAGGKYRFRFGWINGTPGYAIFQEQGTKNGIVAMNALGYATEFLRNELRLLGHSRKSFRATAASRWKVEE